MDGNAPRGTVTKMIAIGTNTDGASHDLTAQVLWTSSNEQVVQISNDPATRGHATATGTGTATIKAAFGGKEAQTSFTVTAEAVPVSLAVDPPRPTVAVAVKQQLHAVATYSDATTRDVTAEATWTSATAAVATVAAAPEAGLVTPVSPGLAVVTAVWQGLSASATVVVSAAPLVSLELAPATASLPAGTTVQLSTTAKFADGSTRSVDASAVWTTDNAEVATVANAPAGGLVTAVRPGTCKIIATFSGVAAHASLTVTAATLQQLSVAPATVSVPAGKTQKFAAFGVYSDASVHNVTAQAAWSGTDPSVAAVSNDAETKGVATALAAGTATVQATLDGKTATAALTVNNATLVSLEITPAEPSVALGHTLQLRANGLYSDGSTRDVTADVSWTSGAPAVAAVSGVAETKGLVTPLAAGYASITAALDGKLAATRLQVTDAVVTALEITPAAPTLASGTRRQFTATATFSDETVRDLTATAVWASSDASILAVSNAAGSRGLASAGAPGSITLSAVVGTFTAQTTVTVSAAALVSIAITPATPTIVKGTSRQLAATGTYSDGTTQDVTHQAGWSVADNTLVTVTNADSGRGLVRGVVAGETIVRATVDDVTGWIALRVVDVTLTSVAVGPAGASVPRGTTQQMTATGTYSDGHQEEITADAVWTVSDPLVAAISNATDLEGVLTARAVGTVVVTATVDDLSGSVPVTVSAAVLQSIEVTAPSLTLPIGARQPLSATGVYSDGTRVDLTAQATWSSTAELVVAVSNADPGRGWATALAVGPADLVAAFGGVTGRRTITGVAATLSALTLAPATATIARGTSLQASVVGTYTDGTMLELTPQAVWSTSDNVVASVSNAAGSNGLVTGVTAGLATITARVGTLSATARYTVTSAVLSLVTIAPQVVTIGKGAGLQLTAVGLFSDGSHQDLTRQAVWTSAQATVAQVNATGYLSALAAAADPVTIRATVGARSGTCLVTVTAPVVVSMTLSPTLVTLPRDTPQRFVARAILTDGTTEDVSAQATWAVESVAPALDVATVNTTGWATGTAPGTAIIRATFQGRTQLATFRVTSARLVSVLMEPQETSLALGLPLQFRLKGTYDNDAVLDVSPHAVWYSSAPTVATVSNGVADPGVVRAVGMGDASIEARISGMTDEGLLHVTEHVLVGVDVRPATLTIDRGTTAQLHAWRRWSDGQTDLITNDAEVVWSSSNTVVATVDAPEGTPLDGGGLVHGLALGSVTIKADYSAHQAGLVGTATLTVIAEHLVGIEVDPATRTIDELTTQAFTATGLWSNGTETDFTATATWTSSATDVATISDTGATKGTAAALKPGTTTISATQGGKTGTAELIVVAATLQSLEVVPTGQTVPVGLTVQYQALAHWSNNQVTDATTDAEWSSSNEDYCTVSNTGATKGLARGVAVGTCTLRAEYGGESGETGLTIGPKAAVSLAASPPALALVTGAGPGSVALEAVFSDGSTEVVTASAAWTTSDANIATVNAGAVSPASQGTAVVTATYGGLSKPVPVFVSTAALASIAVTPATATLAPAATQQFTATGTLSGEGGGTADLSSVVVWSTSAPGVATVSATGLGTAVAAGTATITATLSGLSGTAAVTVQ